MQNLSIKAQFTLLVGTLLGLFILLCSYTLFQLHAIKIELHEVTEEDIPLTKIVTEITTHQLEQAIYFEKGLYYGSTQNIAGHEEKFQKISKAFKAQALKVDRELKEGEEFLDFAIEHAVTEKALAEFKKLREKIIVLEVEHKEYDKHALEVLEFLQDGDLQEIDALIEQVHVEEDHLDEELQEILIEIENFTEQSLLAVEAHEDELIQIVIILMIVSIFLGLLISILIVRQLLRQIGGEPSIIQKIAWEMSQGDLTRQPASGQIHGIYHSLQNLLSRFQHIIGGISQTTENLNENTTSLNQSSIAITSEFEKSSQNLKEIAVQSRELTGTVGKVTEDIANISSNLEQLTYSSDEISGQVSQIASSVEETSTKMSGVSQNINLISSGMNKITNSLHLMTDSLAMGSKKTNTALDISEKAKLISDENLMMMQDLDKTISEVGQVVQLIASIASQTNMLALNATIEAAAAGEAGKGFSVVASEVKELAQETATANQEIAEQIQKIQLFSEKSRKSSQEVSKIIQSITDINENISDYMQEQSEVTSTIFKSAKEITEDTNTSVQKIAGVEVEIQKITKTMSGTSFNVEEGARAVAEGSKSSTMLMEAAKKATDTLVEVDNKIQLIEQSIYTSKTSMIEINDITKNVVKESDDLEEKIKFFQIPKKTKVLKSN